MKRIGVGLFVWVLPLVALGAVAGENRAAGDSAAGMDLKAMWACGGWLMYVLAVLSVLAVAFVIYFAVVLRVAVVAPAKLRREVVGSILNGNLGEARRICEESRSAFAAVALAGIEYTGKLRSADPVLLKDIIQGEGGRQAESIQGQTQYLLDLSVISPMVGMLGTVFGMLNAFSAIALDMAKARPIVLAGGVAQALVTTAFGLIVGIPAMMFYAYFRRRATHVISELEAAAEDVLTSLASKGLR